MCIRDREYLFASFQMTFAAITATLIVGAFAERMKFSAVMLFMVLWFTFSYLPIAHMVWFWAGPDAYTDAAAAEAAGKTAGFLFQKGALDFAGGTVVHLSLIHISEPTRLLSISYAVFCL